jgi:hypothetical protein
MPELLAIAAFAPWLDGLFQVRADGLALDLTLIEAKALRSRAGQLREPFALLFRGPLEPVLPQRLHTVHHEALGSLEIFLVPVGPDETGQRYEAIFN